MKNNIQNRIKLNEKQNKKLELIATLMLIMFALISFFVKNALFDKSLNNIAIYKNGERITEIGGNKIDINNNNSFIIGDLNGEYNIIEINNKKIRCIDSNCPDKICVKHGFLNSNIDNDMIVCAPHRLFICYE